MRLLTSDRCSLLRKFSSDTAPASTSVSVPAGRLPFSDADTTCDRRDTSISTLRLGESRSAGGSSAGTQGRSLATVSSSLFCVRRPRMAMPALNSASSGVSKNTTSRSRPCSGSIRRRRKLIRCSTGTFSFNSTFATSPSLVSTSRSSLRSPASGVVATAVLFKSVPFSHQLGAGLFDGLELLGSDGWIREVERLDGADHHAGRHRSHHVLVIGRNDIPGGVRRRRRRQRFFERFHVLVPVRPFFQIGGREL